MVWDEQGTTALETDVGVTWLELALSLHKFSKHWLPCIRKDDDDVEWVTFPRTDSDASSTSYQATDAATTMWHMWTAYHSLLGPAPVKLQRGLQRSLRVLGASCECSGFKPRPKFPEVTWVVEFSAELMRGKSSYKVPLLTNLGCNSDNLSSMIWKKRKSHLQKGQKMIRGLRQV